MLNQSIGKHYKWNAKKVISKSFVLAGVQISIIRWHSWVCSIPKSPDNKNGYANAEYDQLFEQALKSLNEKERSEIYLKLSEKIQQENLALPLFQYTTPVYLFSNYYGSEEKSSGRHLQ